MPGCVMGLALNDGWSANHDTRVVQQADMPVHLGFSPVRSYLAATLRMALGADGWRATYLSGKPTQADTPETETARWLTQPIKRPAAGQPLKLASS